MKKERNTFVGKETGLTKPKNKQDFCRKIDYTERCCREVTNGVTVFGGYKTGHTITIKQAQESTYNIIKHATCFDTKQDIPKLYQQAPSCPIGPDG